MVNEKKRLMFWRSWEVFCYLIIFIAFILCLAIFIWGKDIYFFNNKYIADDEYLGNFGDFSGGTVGVLIAGISIFLLYRTLRLQRIANHDNRTLLEVQRFNDLYFNLLGLLDKMTPRIQDLRRYKKEINDAVTSNTDFYSRKLKALECYESIYLLNPELGAYFRTLYRILDLIATSEIPEEEKVKYSKILRARFSIDELFLMRYNSLTTQGHKLQDYLWEFQILKHLPASETAEMRYARLRFTPNELIVINSLFSTLRKAVIPHKETISTINQLTGPFFISIDKFNTDNDQSVDVRFDVSQLVASRTTYPNLSRMNTRQCNQLFKDIVDLFNSFSPPFMAQAKFRKTRTSSTILLMSVKFSK